MFTQFLKDLANRMYAEHYQWDDIIFILRPVVYMYFVWQKGDKDTRPIYYSLLMDLVAFVFSLLRLF